MVSKLILFILSLTSDSDTENHEFDDDDDGRVMMNSPHPFSLNLATDSLKTWGPGHRDKLRKGGLL